MNIFAPLNYVIRAAFDAGVSNFIYNVWNVLDYLLVAVFCLKYRYHYGISKRDSLLIPTMLFILSHFFIKFLGWAASGFTEYGANNIVKGYSFFPLFGILVAKLLKLDWKRVMDFSAPAFPLTQFIGHLVCVFVGCCNGYPMKNGIWNPMWDTYVFPQQFLESLVALLIAIACVRIAKREKYRVTGRIYPNFLIMFGGTRFLLEFLRDNQKLFWGISDLALWALLMVVVGTVWLILLEKHPVEPVCYAVKPERKPKKNKKTAKAAVNKNAKRKKK